MMDEKKDMNVLNTELSESEKELIRKIQDDAEKIEVPESLKPSNIELLLQAEDDKKKFRKKSESRHYFGVAAACVAIVACVGVTATIGVPIGKTGSTGSTTKTGESEQTEGDGQTKLAMADSYESVYDYLENGVNEMDVAYEDSAPALLGGVLDGGSSVSSESSTDAAGSETADVAVSSSAKSSDSYSTTNTREESVDEGDIVKTDGQYLYILKSDDLRVSIVDTKNGRMEEVSEITPEGYDYISEMYLDTEDEQLIMLGNGTRNDRGYTIVETYDISCITEPELKATATQTGYYHTSRISDGYLYMFSDYEIYSYELVKDDPDTYIPLLNGEAMDCADICLPIHNYSYQYLVVSSIDLNATDEICDSKAVMSGWGSLYVSEDAIYYYESAYGEDKDYTTIRSIGYKDGNLTAGAKGEVPGEINDSFSIDEYEGYLRVVTTDYSKEEETNGLYILNGAMEIVGEIEDLAPGETVQSARLMEDTGYFVTYENTDPLFSADLSDPENPKIIGKLKIPGFSEYLHPYGDGLLLGIGYDTNADTGESNGLKVTMFDISDPSDVEELDTYVIGDSYYSELFYDYKAVTVSADRNLIGFEAATNSGEAYFIFSYDEEKGFTLNMQEEVNGTNYGTGTRGVYIDDTLYVVNGNVIEAYSLKDYKKTDDLIL